MEERVLTGFPRPIGVNITLAIKFLTTDWARSLTLRVGPCGTRLRPRAELICRGNNGIPETPSAQRPNRGAPYLRIHLLDSLSLAEHRQHRGRGRKRLAEVAGVTFQALLG